MIAANFENPKSALNDIKVIWINLKETFFCKALGFKIMAASLSLFDRYQIHTLFQLGFVCVCVCVCRLNNLRPES